MPWGAARRSNGLACEGGDNNKALRKLYKTARHDGGDIYASLLAPFEEWHA